MAILKGRGILTQKRKQHIANIFFNRKTRSCNLQQCISDRRESHAARARFGSSTFLIRISTRPLFSVHH